LTHNIDHCFENIQKPLQKIAGTVFFAIQKIHNVPLLSKMDIVQVNAKNFDGLFEYFKLGRGIQIKISSNSKNKEFTLLHEIGHIIDNQALGTKGVNESEQPKSLLISILQAIEKTGLIMELRKMQKRKKMMYNNRLIQILPDDYIRLNYYLQPKELWARAYTQYIIIKSENTYLKEQLSSEYQREAIFKTQWLENDFENVIFEIETFLIQQKWKEQSR
jgi:Zn-dependent peptidase ImmA (M78 family)